ncbi:histidine phosphatase family protein [Caulobacter sp. FWC2]|jgi:2,3-bisphosphoglycerate-dependent phosphoglycerate mutase|uniref:histidine phosphatase family protein n=1 Tax=Caulobacter sp. FWC2 TaxID=69664 RepID=UPI000C14C43E|nr:histidine phosphatase family protein [Caulobacter sp. FWC2]PIB92546.1 histidine phosphatase family protein [Caulobacter sp. FWC2]
MEQRWPNRLWIVRHGQSAGNVARDAADAAGMSRIDIADRDMDVALSALGHQQAAALGRWFAGQPAQDRPRTVLTSPYLRAIQTSQAVRDAGGTVEPHRKFCIDERLREKEFGILDRLTRHGIEAQFPDQAEFRRLLGKFYHRPPGGESWCDVILRLRSLIDTLSLHHRGDDVLIVAHQVVVLCLRYLLEGLTEEEILAIDAQADIANCGLTEYRFDPTRGPGGELVLTRYNFTAPLEAQAAPVTAAPDANVAAR